MSYGFEVYIDESGDEGFKFRQRPEPGSSEWLVLSAVVYRRANAPAIIKMVRGVRTSLGRSPTYTLHFAKLGHEARVAWVSQIARSPLRVMSIVIQKPKLARRAVFAQKDRLYFYAVRFLIERVSWFCRDQHKTSPCGDGTARVIFSKRKSMRYEELRSYLARLYLKTPPGDDWLEFLKAGISIHWPSFKIDQVEAAPHHDYAGLQIADAVASGIKQALEYTPLGYTEHRFAKTLRPVTYLRSYSLRGPNLLSYGLKFFPDTPRGEDRFRWIQKYYG